jgi:hypothetical protein
VSMAEATGVAKDCGKLVNPLIVDGQVQRRT